MRTALLLVLALTLAGCIDGGFGGSVPDVPLPGSHGLAAGSASGHSAPQVSRGQVAVRQDGGRYTATQQVTVRNNFGGADRAAVSLASLNGAITVAGTSSDGYSAGVSLYGSGSSEQMARDALATLEVRTPDRLSGSDLSFGVQVAITGSIPPNAGRGASIDLATPRGPHYGLGADTSNGAISVRGLTGDRFAADTSNADVTLDDLGAGTIAADTSNGAIRMHGVAAASAKLDTSNGAIDVDATVDDASLDTSNGPIEGTLRPAASGTYTLDTSNADIALKLPADGAHGYDATASTSNAKATISLPGTEPVGSQGSTHAHVQTTGYGGKSIRTAVTADSSNNDVHIGVA